MKKDVFAKSSTPITLSPELEALEEARKLIIKAACKKAQIPFEYQDLFMKSSRIEITLIDEHAADDDSYKYTAKIEI